MRNVRTHYIYGSGFHGCMYDNGPNLAQSAMSAAESIAQTFDRSDAWAKRFAKDMYVDLGAGPDYCGEDCEACDPAEEGETHNDGADYAEISECRCQDVEEHAEPGDDIDLSDYCDPCPSCDSLECRDEDCGEKEASHA